MIVAHVSQSPLAGSPWAAAAAFREAGYDSFCIAPEAYDTGREVPADYRYPPVGGAMARLCGADVVLCHDGRPYREPWYPAGKPTVGWYHGPPRPDRVDRALEADGWPWGATGAHQTRLYAGAWPLPELYPLAHRLYQPADKPAGRVRIAYSPSNIRAGGWDDKGFCQTVAALNGLDADVEIICGEHLAECLARKAAAHIVIDECVTGSYHRSGLDGLALGCVVVNRCDGLCTWNIQKMTGGHGHPFELADAARLRQTLEDLIDLGPETLAHMGRRNRRWMEEAWDPAALIARNLRPLMDAAIAAAGRERPANP